MNAASPPRVSVLMTTYNGAAFIAEAVGSVLAQTFPHFEVVVVDDASTDQTPHILAGITDTRVRVIRRAVNGGIVAARNDGFAAARGVYIAALDHDDFCRPERLARQVVCLDQHPEVVLVATEVEVTDQGRTYPPDHPVGGDPLLLRWLLCIDNPLTWSSVMFRADAVRGLGAFMRPDFELADDFDLYHRLLAVGDIARLEVPLTVYRWHAQNTSIERAALLNANAAKVLHTVYLPMLGTDAQEAADLAVRHLCERRPARDIATLRRLGWLLHRLFQAFCDARNLDTAERSRLASVAGEAWWRTVRAAVRAGIPRAAGCYRGGPLTSAFRPPAADIATSIAIGCLRAITGRAAGTPPGRSLRSERPAR